MSEFPKELIERCAEKALRSGGSDRGWIGVTEAVLRESGHAELVEALEAMLAFVGYQHMNDDDLRRESGEGNGFTADILAARIALRKAGAL